MSEGSAAVEARTIPEELRLALPQLIEDAKLPGANLGELLNTVLRRFVMWPFRVNRGKAVDVDGVETATFDTLIYTSPDDLTRVPKRGVASHANCSQDSQFAEFC